jgi:tetratricopeptide (TPR) repeat protein
MPGVFISYQKSSTRHIVGRLDSFLGRRFGPKQIFRDSARLQAGDKWWPTITDAIGKSSVLLVVIGTDWLEHLEASNAAAESGDGWVQQEILLAMEKGVGVIPVLVDEATMPRAEDLPTKIAGLGAVQAQVLTDRTFDADAEALAKVLEEKFGVRDDRWAARRWWDRTTKPLRVLAAVISVVAAGLSIWVILRGENRSPIISCSVQFEAVAGIAQSENISTCASDPDGDELSMVPAAQSTHGATIVDNGAGSVTYTAPPTYFGNDQFEYDAVDEDGSKASGMVFVTVVAGAMDKELNVAVAELSTVGGDQAATLGQALTATLVTLVSDGLAAEEELSVDVAGPDRVGTIDGLTFEEQGESVGATATRLNAHVVLYGVLSADGTTTVETRMFLSPQALAGALELAGPYPLNAVSVSSSGPAAVRMELERIIRPTVLAIADLSRGLAFYQVNRYEEAEAALLAAAENWPVTPGASNGQEVLWQLLGNVNGKQGRFDDARRYYEMARDVGANDARASFGLAELRFMQARGRNCGAATGESDLAALDGVTNDFAEVESMTEPEGSFLKARARSEIGRVLLCLSVNGMDHVDEARSVFQGVIQEFGSVGALDDLIAEAHGALGFSYFITRDFPEAIEEYLKATSTNDKSRRAFFYNTIGGIYECDLRDMEKATVAYELSDSFVSRPLERRDCTATASLD